MAADLHIHIFEGLEEEDLKRFFSNSLGSKYFNLSYPAFSLDDDIDHFSKINRTPNIWIGSVSWLKAGLFQDPKTFIPDPIGKINTLIGEDLVVLDEELMKNIMDALDLENVTGYKIAKPEDVVGFLTTYQGSQVFSVSW